MIIKKNDTGINEASPLPLGGCLIHKLPDPIWYGWDDYSYYTYSTLIPDPNRRFLDVSETSETLPDGETMYVFRMDVPGVKKSDITIDYTGGVLSVTAKRYGEGSDKSLFRNYAWTKLLGDSTSRLSQTKAVLNDGVLTISVVLEPVRTDNNVIIEIE